MTAPRGEERVLTLTAAAGGAAVGAGATTGAGAGVSIGEVMAVASCAGGDCAEGLVGAWGAWEP